MGAISHDGGVAFRVWAPHAEQVWVMGTFNDWSPEAHPMAQEEHGYWYANMPEASVGDEYRLLLQRGHAVEPLDSARLRRRFPPWTAEHCLACGYISGGEVLMSERVALAWNDKPTHPTCSMPMTFTSMQ